jgi:hypothetical protein
LTAARAITRPLLALTAVIGATALLAEVAVRVMNPTPRLQIVRPDVATTLEARDGTVVWTLDTPEITSNGCANAPEDAFRVSFVGSSIFRGSGVSGEQTFTTALQQHADGWCVDNPSQPAFTAGQKRVVALDALKSPRPPDLLFWEVWTNDPDGYTLIDGVAYNLAGLQTDVRGVPDAFSLPAGLNGWLFRTSALHRYATLALITLSPKAIDQAAQWDELLARDLLPVVEKAREVGTELILVICPRLDQSFDASTSRPPEVYGRVWPFAQQHGLRWIQLAQRLEGQDVEALRVDTCCHYNPAGHAALAEVFEQEIRKEMTAPAP